MYMYIYIYIYVYIYIDICILGSNLVSFVKSKLSWLRGTSGTNFCKSWNQMCCISMHFLHQLWIASHLDPWIRWGVQAKIPSIRGFASSPMDHFCDTSWIVMVLVKTLDTTDTLQISWSSQVEEALNFCSSIGVLFFWKILCCGRIVPFRGTDHVVEVLHGFLRFLFSTAAIQQRIVDLTSVQ